MLSAFSFSDYYLESWPILALPSCWFLEFSSSPVGLKIARKEEVEQFEVVGLPADNSRGRLVEMAAPYDFYTSSRSMQRKDPVSPTHRTKMHDVYRLTYLRLSSELTENS
ncbi:MAG: hypothetical protein K0R47_4790 [Brevibacillus sp.]|nr:hypothetical protein [Brevibacillus sp.]